tara:strand:+ start:129 stop:515 length:387 start_codon:yes stop_codon:yes gene_type:complete
MSSSKSYKRSENPYLNLNFFKFFALSTAMILFFPWSLLFCLIVLGFEKTKLIIYALIEDIGITLLGALAAFVIVIFIILGSIKYFFMWWNQPEPQELNKVNSHSYEIRLKVSEINQRSKLIDITDYIS